MSGQRETGGPTTAAAAAMMDCVMNWVVGVLLVLSLAVVIFFQTNPPR
jgi:hypothetical protein